MAAKRSKDLAPDQELKRLEGVLAEGLPRALFVRGDEAWYRQQAADLVVAAGKQAGLEICRHDTADPEFKLLRLLDDLAGGALFAGGRCVLVRGANDLLRKGSRVHAPGLGKALMARLAQGGEGCVILEGKGLRADNKVLKDAKTQGAELFSFRRLWDSPPPWKPDPREAELVLWLVRHSRARGVPLAPDQAVYLVAATGNDLAALDGQLDRAAASGGKLEQAVVWDPGGTPWALADLLVDGQVQRAVAGLESLFNGGFTGNDGRRESTPEALVAMLGPAVSGKAREALAVARGGPDSPPGGRPQGGARAREALAARAKGRTAVEWQRMVEDAADLERRARSGPSVGASDWCAFALRWRSQPSGGRRGAGSRAR